MKLIGLSGLARSGKDTIADYLRDEHNFIKYSFASPLKKAVRVMFSLTEEHTDGAFKEEIIPWLGVSPRYLMQTLGTEYGRGMVRDDVWIVIANKHWTDLLERNEKGSFRVQGMVVSDVRFDNEAAWVRENDGEIWHIERPGNKKVREHASESGVLRHPRDRVIINDGTIPELIQKVGDLI